MPLRADVATGAATLFEPDLRLPGFIPLELARTYRSRDAADGPFGRGWSFNLDIALHVLPDRLVLHDASGREVGFARLAEGMQARHVATGLTIQHWPDAFVVFASPLLKQVFPKRNAVRDVIPLDRIEDPNDNTIQFAYGGRQLAGVTDTVGRRILFAYEGKRLGAIRVVGTRGETATVRTFRYDAAGDLVAVGDAAGVEARYLYRNHLMVACTNRTGGTQFAQYDRQGRCLALWYGDGSQVRRLAYDDRRQTTRVTDPHGRQWLYRRVQDTYVLAQVDPQARSQHYYYDEQQRLVGFSEGKVALQFERLDPESHTLVQLDGEAHAAFFQFDEAGLARSVADALENTYTLEYDDRYNLSRLVTPSGGAWTFERDRRGQVTAVVGAEGRQVRLRYDRDGRALTVEDELGLRFQQRYDAMGRPVERLDALGRREHRRYDAEGRLLEVVLQGGYTLQFDYDAEGRLSGVSDTEGRRERVYHDAFGLLRKHTTDGARWQFVYDREGRLAAGTNPYNRPGRFTYDELGRLTEFIPFGGPAARYRYEEGGLTIVSRQGEADTTRVFSPLRELTREIHPDGRERAFEYGPSGELVEAAWEGGGAVFAYEEEGRLAGITTEEAELAFRYTPDGHLASVEDGEGRRVVLQYDARGRVHLVQEGEPAAPRFSCRLAYDAADRLQALYLPAGVHFAFGYDVLDRLLERQALDAAARRLGWERFDPRAAAAPVPVDLTAPAPMGGTAEVQADGQAGEGSRLVLLQSALGLELLACFGELQVPVWYQDAYLYGGEANLTARTICSVVQGPGSILARRRRLDAGTLLRRWTGERDRDFRFLYTALPTSREVGRMGSVPDLSFLARAYYDYHYPQQAPTYMARHLPDPARSPDPMLTGPHRMARLRAPAWPERSMGVHLHADLTLRRGGLLPGDLLLSTSYPA